MMAHDAVPGENRCPKRFTIPYLRWWIGGLLFMMTVINYIDRQTLGALSPYLKEEFDWTTRITRLF